MLRQLPEAKATMSPTMAAPVHTQSAYDRKPCRVTVLLISSITTTSDATNAVVLE